MLAEVNGQPYVIQFYYPDRKKDNRSLTKCVVSTAVEKEENKVEKGEEISVGVAIKSPKDKNFSKIVGRKVALLKALKSVFNKEERTQIWSQYLEEFKYN